MKQISIFTIFLLAISSASLFSMHHETPDYLMFDKSRMPFVFDAQKTASLDDTDYSYRVETKTLMILIAEVSQVAHNRSVPSFFELIEKIKKGTIKLDHITFGECGNTLVTQKDIEGRLLCYIRVFGTCGIDPEGKDPHVRGGGGRVMIPVILGHQIAHLHHYNFGPHHMQRTQLADSSSFKEISSRNYDDCKRRVEEIIQRYHPSPR